MRKRKFKIIIFIFTMLILILLSGFIIYKLHQSYQNIKEKDKVKEEIQEIIDSIKEEDKEQINKPQEENIILKYQKTFNNTDIIAELTLVNTDMTVPVAKTTDNEYYLNHLLNKKQNDLGSVFMDYRNNPIDRKILIYGHNSQTVDTEFDILESYLNPKFLKDHSMIQLKTIDKIYNYKIFSIVIVTTDYQHMKLNFTADEYDNHLKWLKNNSVYDTGITVEKTDEIIILQTCYYEPEDSYLLLVGKKI